MDQPKANYVKWIQITIAWELGIWIRSSLLEFFLLRVWMTRLMGREFSDERMPA